MPSTAVVKFLQKSISGLPRKSNGFFFGPCAAFSPNLMKIGLVILFAVLLTI